MIDDEYNEATEGVLRMARAFYGLATSTAETLTTTEISHEPVVLSSVITTTGTNVNGDESYFQEDNITNMIPIDTPSNQIVFDQNMDGNLDTLADNEAFTVHDDTMILIDTPSNDNVFDQNMNGHLNKLADNEDLTVHYQFFHKKNFTSDHD